jgi:hypothetical protein
MPKDRSVVTAREPDAGAVRMDLLFCEGTKLAAVQPADALTTQQLKTCLDLQRGMGRDTVVFELIQEPTNYRREKRGPIDDDVPF